METTVFSLFLIGLSYGTTACMLSCMPFLTPILTRSKTTAGGLKTVFAFSAGRVVSYTLLALLAFYFGALIKTFFQNNSLISFFLGFATLSLGLLMIKQSMSPRRKCKKSKIALADKNVFAIGALMALNPCLPLLSLITLSAAATSYFSAASFGVMFGIGAVAFSFLFYGFFLSTLIGGLLKEFQKYAKAIELLSATFLIILGVLIMNQKIIL